MAYNIDQNIDWQGRLAALNALEEKCAHVVARFYDEIIKQGNLSVIDEIISVDYRLHTPLGEIIPPGRDGFRNLYVALVEAFPCLHLEIKDIIAQDDKVAVRYLAHGTHEKEIFGLEPTGKKWSLEGIDIFRLHKNQIAEHWNIFDRLSILKQLSLI